MGRVGATALAGTGLSVFILNLSLILFGFLSMVTTPAVAKALAKGDMDRLVACMPGVQETADHGTSYLHIKVSRVCSALQYAVHNVPAAHLAAAQQGAQNSSRRLVGGSCL